MNNYTNTQRKTVSDISDHKISELYANGFVFTRVAKGVLDQVRSMRIDLSDFQYNSENRRIIKKIEGLDMQVYNLPIDPENYDFRIHKMGKDFYKSKNDGNAIFSASKIKELLVDQQKSNFSKLYVFSFDHQSVGYCIVYENQDITHYAFPFYDLNSDIKNLGMGMIIRSIERALAQKKKYFYLGSVHTEKSLYKLQFKNSQWWNYQDSDWSEDISELKQIVRAS